jgi:hypothetical protein
MKDDKDELESLWTFCCSADKKADKRLHYVCSVSEIHSHKAGDIVIVDESDEVLFKDLRLFYRKTKPEDTKVIALTATADDGVDFGSERKVLE